MNNRVELTPNLFNSIRAIVKDTKKLRLTASNKTKKNKKKSTKNSCCYYCCCYYDCCCCERDGQEGARYARNTRRRGGRYESMLWHGVGRP